MKDLGSRTISTVISLVILISLVLFAQILWVRFLIFAVTSLIAVIAVREYEHLATAKGGKMIYFVLAPLTVLLVFAFFLESQGFKINHLPLIAMLISIWILFGFHFRHREGAVVDLAVSLFGLFYISVPLGMMLSILYLPGGGDGRLWFVYLISVTKITDVGAYIVGSLWGKRKLAPQISPGKTVEGAAFGWLSALGTSVLFYGLSAWLQEPNFQLSLPKSLWLGAILGLASQFGDLSESLLKRDADKKDSSTLPGIGGILDMVDSLLFSTPIVYLCVL